MIESLLAYTPFETCAGQAYDEETFRHFLALERKRAEHSGRSFLLVLVHLRRRPGNPSRMPAGAAASLFAGLAYSVREVDFFGWYRHGRVAGAVLAQGAEPPTGAQGAVARRVTRAIARRLPDHLADRLHVRVIQLRGRVQC